MAKLRNFQFLRNNTIAGPFASYALARTAAETAFGKLVLQDGEIALYSYKLDSDATTVHTLLGIKRTNGIEILGNYDELTAEYQSYVTNAINALDTPEGGVTGSNNGVSVTVKQVDGKIDSVSVVAPSLTDAIAALDVDPFYLTELNGNKLEGYQISEVDGKIVKGQTAETLLTFASAPTAENKVVTQSEINALNATKSGSNTIQDITVEVVETAGKITKVNVSDTLATVAHSGKAADVAIVDKGNLYTAGNVEDALAEVMAKANELDAAQLSAGKGIDIVTSTVDGVTTNSINADLKLSIANETTGEGESAVTTTYLYIKDTEGNEISKLDASEFVKDGFLQSVVLDEENGELVFTWNTDAEGAGEQNQVTRIAISELCDVYTAKANDWIQLNGFEFYHKTQDKLTPGTYADNTADVTVDSTTSKSFQVPTLTVDAAGHVTAASEKTVTITLPASIDTAIQGGAGVNTTYIQTTVTRNATNTNQLDVTATAVIGDYAAEGQVNGLATTTATKTYVDSKISTTILVGGNGINVVDSGSGNNHIYEVNMNGVTRIDNPDTEGKPSTSSFADDTTTFTYVKEVKTDTYGRVTGILTETVTEFFDAGTY